MKDRGGGPAGVKDRPGGGPPGVKDLGGGP